MSKLSSADHRDLISVPDSTSETRVQDSELRQKIIQPRAPQGPDYERKEIMLQWALTFFIVAIIAAVFGFGGIAAGAAGIAKILFFVFIVLFLLSLLSGLARRGDKSVKM